ncbi:purple acid phosphatase-like [Camellia sinensis]|uniref:purple acid phosphatase-like n=1 Tax=Camellia sinensis TaxID=4442 RepID=UPI001035919B|nr:purple acid phosphatase-like [Camellia sinensis]
MWMTGQKRKLSAPEGACRQPADHLPAINVKNVQIVDSWLPLTALSSTKGFSFVISLQNFISVSNSSKNEPFFTEKLLDWIVTLDGSEKIKLDFAPNLGESVPFKPYLHRYHVPYKASQSTSPLWYSIKRASTYIIVLSSYSAYGKYTPQYKWLEQELPKINRSETPWIIVILHAPWYNSNHYHYMEGESMRVQFEPWFVQHKVDIVFAGHVHSYERSERISNVKYNITNGLSGPVRDSSAPVYITIGDGGNIEGIADNFIDQQPSYSAYREASFGHAILEIKNRTHAYYTWHRNQDNEPVIADSAWFFNRFWYPEDESSINNKEA